MWKKDFLIGNNYGHMRIGQHHKHILTSVYYGLSLELNDRREPLGKGGYF